jgi:hypothetical protein
MMSSSLVFAANEKKDYRVTAVSSMVKLRSNQLPPRGESVESSFSLHGARGEGESGQILITAIKPLKKVTVTARPLTGPKGFTIALELLLAAYVPIKKPVLPPVGFGVAGDYPDPLLPIKSFDIPSKISQSVFFNVWVPAGAPAGEYTGSITISPENAKPETIALKFRVYDVTLPKQSFLKTDMQIWNFLTGWYGANYSREMLTRTRLLCLKYRCTSPEWMDLKHFITINTDGTFSANWVGFDQAVQYNIDQGATVFRLQDLFVCQKYNLPETPQAEADLGMRLKLVEEHLKAKGWLDWCYFYIFDEPDPDKIPQIKTLCRLIHKYAPKLRIIFVYNEGLKNETPSELIGYVNLWVPIMGGFNPSFLSGRQAAGEEVWAYSCGSRSWPYPNGIDHVGSAARAVGWWCWRYKVTGFLYWGMDYWVKDPWADPEVYPGVNGDGYLLYPDPKKIHDPYPSIRLLCTRDGFEDYDLMYLLQKRIGEIKSNAMFYRQNKTLIDHAESLLDLSNVIKSKMSYIQNSNVYEQRHRRILENLESFKGLISGNVKSMLTSDR